MKAIVYTEYGPPDVLKLAEVEKPTPADNEILVKVHTASVNAYDWHLLRAEPFLARFDTGMFKPKKSILGGDVAGEVEAVGKKVTQFKAGDAVFGSSTSGQNGSFAEYTAVPERAVVLKPASMSYEQAAAIPMAALTALQGLRDGGQLQPGQKVLIHGTSGGVGTFAVQIAKVLGAEVTGVCSTSKMEMTRSLGADHVVDYTKEDFTKRDERYDLILGVNGSRSLSDYRRALKPEGRYIMVGGSNAQIFSAMFLGGWMSMLGGNKMSAYMSVSKQADLAYISELFEAGKVTPVIDRCYPLEEVADAIRYLETMRAAGKVIINVTK
jgi:NADPH:quinone reductase-like Zn-dependent oxidoreductase